ncbi:unnamed protein product, partial [Laminaria digitata]
ERPNYDPTSNDRRHSARLLGENKPPPPTLSPAVYGDSVESMALPTVASLMRQRSAQVVQSRGVRAGTELIKLAPWGLPALAA